MRLSFDASMFCHVVPSLLASVYWLVETALSARGAALTMGIWIPGCADAGAPASSDV
jgi:hypothetical protein